MDRAISQKNNSSSNGIINGIGSVKSGSSLGRDNTLISAAAITRPPPPINTTSAVLAGQRMSNYSNATDVEILQPDIYNSMTRNSSTITGVRRSTFLPNSPFPEEENMAMISSSGNDSIEDFNRRRTTTTTAVYSTHNTDRGISTEQVIRRRATKVRETTSSNNINDNGAISRKGDIVPRITSAEFSPMLRVSNCAATIGNPGVESHRSTTASTDINQRIPTVATSAVPLRTYSMKAPRRRLSRIQSTPVERRVDFTSKSELKKFNKDHKFVFHRGFLKRTLGRFSRNTKIERSKSRNRIPLQEDSNRHLDYTYKYGGDPLVSPSPPPTSRSNTPNSKKFRTHKQLRSVMQYIDLQSMDIGEQIPVPLEFVYAAQNLYLMHNTQVGPPYHRMKNNQRLEQTRSVVVPLLSIPRQNYSMQQQQQQLSRQLSRSHSIRRKLAAPRPLLASTTAASRIQISDSNLPASSQDYLKEGTEGCGTTTGTTTRHSSLRRRNTSQRSRLRQNRSLKGSSTDLPTMIQRVMERDEIQRLWRQFMELIIWRRIRLRLLLLNASSISSLSSTLSCLDQKR